MWSVTSVVDILTHRPLSWLSKNAGLNAGENAGLNAGLNAGENAGLNAGLSERPRTLSGKPRSRFAKSACADSMPDRGRAVFRRLAWLMALLAWFVAPQAAHANPTVTQGSSATFARSGTSSPASFPWDIVLSGSAVASASATNGWSVSYNSSAQQFTVGAPISATVATGYEVRYYAAMGGASAIFDVVAATLQVSSLTISPTSIIGGGAVSGTVTLNLAAPTGGAAVALSCSTALAALFPATVTVAAGQTSATFTINTSTANFPITVTFTAAFGGQNATAALTLLPTNLHADRQRRRHRRQRFGLPLREPSLNDHGDRLSGFDDGNRPGAHVHLPCRYASRRLPARYGGSTTGLSALCGSGRMADADRHL